MPTLSKKDEDEEGYEKYDRAAAAAAARPGQTQWGIRQSNGRAAWASTTIDA